MNLLLPANPHAPAAAPSAWRHDLLPSPSASEETRPASLTVRGVDEILSMSFPEDDFLWRNGYLSRGEPLTILGAGGIGKSRLVMQAAICSILGRDFVGMETGGCAHRWLFLQSENSNRRLQHDLAFYRRWVGPEAWGRVGESLFFHTLETDVDSLLYLDDAETRARLLATIAGVEPDVIVWDALKDFGAGNLNMDADMQAAVSMISRLTKTGNPRRVPVVVHHAGTGKAGASKAVGFDRNHFGRNSKILQAWTRAQINVAAYSPDNNDCLVIASGKCNNHREFAPFGVRLDPETMIYHPDSALNIDAWQEKVSGGEGKSARAPHEDIPALLEGEPLTRAQLVEAVRAEHKVAEKTAYRWITQADEAGLIIFDTATKTFAAC